MLQPRRVIVSSTNNLTPALDRSNCCKGRTSGIQTQRPYLFWDSALSIGVPEIAHTLARGSFWLQNSLVLARGPCFSGKAILAVAADGVAGVLAVAAPGVAPGIQVMLATALADHQTAPVVSTRNGGITNNSIQHNK